MDECIHIRAFTCWFFYTRHPLVYHYHVDNNRITLPDACNALCIFFHFPCISSKWMTLDGSVTTIAVYHFACTSNLWWRKTRYVTQSLFWHAKNVRCEVQLFSVFFNSSNRLGVWFFWTFLNDNIQTEFHDYVFFVVISVWIQTRGLQRSECELIKASVARELVVLKMII